MASPLRRPTCGMHLTGELDGTFHPELLLMMANERVAVGLGSANLTPEGLRESPRLWGFLKHS